MDAPADENQVTPIALSGPLRSEEYVESALAAFSTHYRRQRLWALGAGTAAFAGLLALFLYYGLDELLDRHSGTAMIAAGLGTGYLVYAMFAGGNRRRDLGNYALETFGDTDHAARIEATGIALTTGPYEWRSQWSGFTDWGETPNTYWLWAGALVVLPKRLLSESEVSLVRELLDRCIVRGDPRKRGFEVVVAAKERRAEA